MSNSTLVVGSSGFIGSNIFRALNESKNPVIGAARKPKHENQRPLLLEDRAWLRQLLLERDYSNVIFALGGASGSGDKHMNQDVWQAFKMGIVTAQDLLSYCSKVIYLGSAAEYGRATSPFIESSPLSPVDDYGLAKVVETSFMSSVSEKSFALTVVRPSSVYGPKQTGSMFIPSALRAAAIGYSLEISKPLAVRDFLYIDDLAEAIVRMIQGPAALPTVLNLSSGYEASMKQVADRIELSLGLQGVLFTYPNSHADLGQQDIVRIDSSLARNLLSWEPHVSLDEGVPLAAKL